VDSLLLRLTKDFGFEREYAILLSNVAFENDYSSLSTKAIRKILPHLMDGERYDIACSLAGYNHSKSETVDEKKNRDLNDNLEILPKNSLRNPVVEKIINQMIHVVNGVIDTYGKPDEVRIELARELKKNAAERESLTKNMSASNKQHEEIIKVLKSEFSLMNPTRNDVIRYKLYEELKDNGYKTLYSDTYISKHLLFSGEIDIEHIIPQSKLFDDSFSNKTLELRSVNIKKGNATARDFVRTEYGEDRLTQYEERVRSIFYRDGKKGKFMKLMWEEKDIPSDFINRDLQDTRYISKKAKELLLEVIREVNSTTGSITDKLRDDWQLTDVLKELNLPKYELVGMVEELHGKNGNRKKVIKDWTKRNDHRHHAMDAITVAFTKPSYIQYLNNLSARSDKNGIHYAIQQKETYFDNNNKRRFKPPMPLDVLRTKVKEQLENLLVSFKAKNKVATLNKNKISIHGAIKTQLTATPRGPLHNETIYGSSWVYVTKNEKVNASFDAEKIQLVAKKKYREALIKRLDEFGNDPSKAFTGKNTLEKNPLFCDEAHSETVPTAVKLVYKEKQFTIRKNISPDLKIDKVVDAAAKKVLQERLNRFGGDAKKAFSNLEEDPIWLNKEAGICLKSVTITGVSNAEPLRAKKDHLGKELLDENGTPQPVDYINTGNNHHVAIFLDKNGDLQEEVVSLLEAVTRKNQGLSIIRKGTEEGWEFLFSMKQNEYFVFPNDKTGFDPQQTDLLDPSNYTKISQNLFRVQKLTSRDYFFRHHLETTVDTTKETKELTWKRCGLSGVKDAVKVRLNHLGNIISIGEF
jgi:CRISPR-associated endonuclease Csn1